MKGSRLSQRALAELVRTVEDRKSAERLTMIESGVEYGQKWTAELDAHEQNRRYRIEAEVNRFAAALLMPATRVRASLASTFPNLAEIVRLARDFDVSKEAMARTYVDASRTDRVVGIAAQKGPAHLPR